MAIRVLLMLMLAFLPLRMMAQEALEDSLEKMLLTKLNVKSKLLPQTVQLN